MYGSNAIKTTGLSFDKSVKNQQHTELTTDDGALYPFRRKTPFFRAGWMSIKTTVAADQGA